MTTTTKIAVTKDQFEKQVETEFSYLTYMDRLPRSVALEQARKSVAERFEVSGR